MIGSRGLISTPRYRLVCNCFPDPGGGLPVRISPGTIQVSRSRRVPLFILSFTPLCRWIIHPPPLAPEALPLPLHWLVLLSAGGPPPHPPPGSAAAPSLPAACLPVLHLCCCLLPPCRWIMNNAPGLNFLMDTTNDVSPEFGPLSLPCIAGMDPQVGRRGGGGGSS